MNIHIILPIVIVIAIIIYYDHIHQEDPLQEGLSNDLKKITNSVKKVSKTVKKVANSVKKLENIFKCPINLFSNLHICSLYYAQDIIFFFLWLFVYLNMYFFLYWPIKLLSLLLCAISKKSLCFSIKPSDICISKRAFFSAIEQPYYTITGKHLLNRTSKDIKRCYCVPYPPFTTPFVKNAIRPLTGFRSVESKFSAFTTAMGAVYVGIPIILMGFIYFISPFYRNKEDESNPIITEDSLDKIPTSLIGNTDTLSNIMGNKDPLSNIFGDNNPMKSFTTPFDNISIANGNTNTIV